jgi:hypothetical protein
MMSASKNHSQENLNDPVHWRMILDYAGKSVRKIRFLAKTRRSLEGKAGKGNRTLIASLEGWSFTIKLCPRFAEKT